jgi:hypothetical protein
VFDAKPDQGSIRPRVVARYAPSVAVPQPSISKAHVRAANKSKTTAAITVFPLSTATARPKSFASVWRNCRAHVEELAQWRAGFQIWGINRGAIMTIAEYLAATALIALIVWAVLGLLMQES